MIYYHEPVLLKEVLEYLNPKPNQNFLDGTVGGGGHAKEILRMTSPAGHLLGLDRDMSAIKAAADNLVDYQGRFFLYPGSYGDIKTIIKEFPFELDGILLDLGISSFQVSEEDDRGFSFKKDSPLDMRFGTDTELTAADILNNWPKAEILKILRQYGEEPRANPIANKIIEFRKEKAFASTFDLLQIIDNVYRPGRKFKLNPATKVFQALRIAVNDELENLKKSLPDLLDVLKPGGRMVILSYHSLEDRIVKKFFKDMIKECVCPPEFPVCRCDWQAKVKILTKKPLIPTAEEIKSNSRSRSAKLRAVIKL